jgi:hypothetical protein
LDPNTTTKLVWCFSKRFKTSVSWYVQKLIPTQHWS